MLNITKHKFVGKAERKKIHSNMFESIQISLLSSKPNKTIHQRKRKKKYITCHILNSNSIPKIQTSIVLIQRGAFI